MTLSAGSRIQSTRKESPLSLVPVSSYSVLFFAVHQVDHTFSLNFSLCVGVFEIEGPLVKWRNLDIFRVCDILRDRGGASAIPYQIYVTRGFNLNKLAYRYILLINLFIYIVVGE
jgi:hypothetical protein